MTFRCGHAKYGPNVRVTKSGKTTCRACERERNRLFRRQEKQRQIEALQQIQVSR